MMRRATLLVVAGLLLTASCGSAGPDDPAVARVEHNATDVMFAQMMVAREQETADLIRVAQDRSLPPEAVTLVEAIRTTQADEARTMKGWLTGWGQPAAMDPDAAAHQHHGGLDSLSAADLAELQRVDDGDFPTRFLNLLIAQQHNAVELARMENATGTHAGAEDLARRIDRSRTAQIATLLTLADRLTGP